MIVDYIYGVMYARFFMFCIMGSILNIIALFVLLKNKHKVNVYFLIYGLLGNILGGMLIFFLSEFILNLSHFEFFYAFKSMFYSTMLPAYIHCLIIVVFYFFPIWIASFIIYFTSKHNKMAVDINKKNGNFGFLYFFILSVTMVAIVRFVIP